MKEALLHGGERIVFALRELYRRYGYRQYKMGKFEEYDLYAGNKDFLVSDNIITFTDTNGALMALKPDVTLSIVRSARPEAGCVEKVYYDENVYRAARGGRFREIRQLGLECIGDIGDYDVSEAVMLAAESLERISADWALSLSHLGILSEALDDLGLSEGKRRELIRCIGEKNMHELMGVCRDEGVDAAKAERFRKLVSAAGAPREVLSELHELGCGAEALHLIESIFNTLERRGFGERIRMDFSVLNDMNYYDGVVFKGFVSGAPAGVLSGGQYGRLMRKMGKRCGAVGYAVYMDMLERFYEQDQGYDLDAVLLYTDDDSLERIQAAVEELSAQGLSVSAQKTLPEKLTFRRLIRLGGEEVNAVGQDA